MINDLSDLRTCLPEAIINGRDMLLHPMNAVEFNYLSPPLIPAYDTQVLI